MFLHKALITFSGGRSLLDLSVQATGVELPICIRERRASLIISHSERELAQHVFQEVELPNALCGFPPIATKHLGITTNLGAIRGFYGTEIVIRL